MGGIFFVLANPGKLLHLFCLKAKTEQLDRSSCPLPCKMDSRQVMNWLCAISLPLSHFHKTKQDKKDSLHPCKRVLKECKNFGLNNKQIAFSSSHPLIPPVPKQWQMRIYREMTTFTCFIYLFITFVYFL